jgi:Bacterial PH domain
MSYRRHTVRFGIGLLWLTPVAVLTPFVLDLSPDGVPVPPENRLIYLAICLPFLALSVRTMRIGVFTDENGVTVRGVLRSRRLRWDEIAAFEWGAWGGWPCGTVRRADGSRIVVFALNPPLGDDDRIDALLAELNAELAARPGSRSSGPGSARSAA